MKLADWTKQNKSSVLQYMLKECAAEDVISFALGLPAEEFFPATDFGDILKEILANKKKILQYSPPLSSLKTHIVELMKIRGVNCSEEQIFLTAGSQQAATLLVNLLLEKNGKVIVEEKVYTGFQQVLKSYQPQLIVVPTNAREGVDLTALEDVLKRVEEPAFFYTVTDGHNPLALSLSFEKRKSLVNLSRKYNLKIIEDDPYGFIHYEKTNLPPLRGIESENIFYLGTFSKILAPSLRTGWLIVPEELIAHLENVKEANDINTATLSQHLINEYMNSGKFPAHLENLKLQYKERRDKMLDLLEKNFGEIADWETPRNGLFIWLEFKNSFDTVKLLKFSLEKERVAFIPGNMFNVAADESISNSMRLNFTALSPDKMEEGIKRLARAIETFNCSR